MQRGRRGDYSQPAGGGGLHGRTFTIKKIDASANTVTINGSGAETIDGITPQVINYQWTSHHHRMRWDRMVHYMSYAEKVKIQAYKATAWADILSNDAGILTCSQDYLQAMAEGDIANHTPWSKIGYAVMPATTETDIYSYGGTIPVIPLIATAATLKVQSNNAADTGTSIFAGTSSGGTATSLIDATKNFNGGTAVAIGDCVILDAGGAVPEWGYVTAVTGNTELAIGGGFSSGGTGASRTYTVIDYSNQAGAHAMLINGLDANYATIREVVIPAYGSAVPGYVATTKSFLRVNSFRMIAAGANAKPTGALALMDSAASPSIVYTYITAGFTRARNSIYTVPHDKTLYITHANVSFGANSANKTEYCRLYLRAAQYTSEDGAIVMRTNMTPGVVIWYPYAEVVVANSVLATDFGAPIKIKGSTSLKMSGAASGAGIASVVLRGWME